MAGVKIDLLFVGIFVIFLGKSVGSNDCHANQDIFCESLRSSKGFTYTVPSSITCFGNCEQGWYFQNGTFIVDSSLNADGQGLSIVVHVTSENLTLSVCENLQWQLNCGTCICNINYTVTDKKHSPAHEEQDGNHGNGLPTWGIALLGLIGIVGAGACAFIAILFRCLRKKKSANDSAIPSVHFAESSIIFNYRISPFTTNWPVQVNVFVLWLPRSIKTSDSFVGVDYSFYPENIF